MWTNIRFCFFFSFSILFSSSVLLSIFWVFAGVISLITGAHITEFISSSGTTIFLTEKNYIIANIGVILFSLLIMWLFSKLSIFCFKKSMEISKQKLL